MDSRSDPDLLRLAREFDLSAITTIYDQHNQALYYYALHLLGDPSLAEDCVSEIFSRLLKALHTGKGPDNFIKPYLFQCAHNWITDYYRRTTFSFTELTDDLIESDQDDPGDLVDVHLSQQHLRDALRLLTPEQRQVISLRYVEGWEIEEVAQSINKPIGAVKALQHRAIAALQKLLKPESEVYGLVYEYK